MELTLKRLLEQAKFTTTRKGYDQTEVDDFLDKAVAMATKVEARLTQALEEAKSAGGRADAAPAAESVAAVAAPVGPSEEEIEARISTEVEQRVKERLAAELASPDRPAAPHEEQGADEAHRTLLLAQRTADAAVREAREEAEGLTAKARAEAQRITAEAASRAEADRQSLDAELASARSDAHSKVSGEITELQSARDGLRNDVDVLGRHVEQQRSQLRETLSELQRLVDDPTSFRVVPAPSLPEPELPLYDETKDPASASPAAEDAGSSTDAGPVPEAPSEVVDAPMAAGDSAEQSSPASDASAGGSGSSADEVPQAKLADFDHDTPGVDEPADSGPPTAPVSALDLGFDVAPLPAEASDDDAFLAELRQAMADQEPLGPRDLAAAEGPGGFLDDEDERRRWRFGKR